MNSTLTVCGTPMQTDLKLNELPRALAEEAPNLVVYEWQPIPGRIMGAAFDWVAILGTTSDILALAGALWTVYEKLIRQRKKPDSKKPPGFLIQVKTEHETFVQFIIQEGTKKEVFIEEFERTVSALRSSESSEAESTVIECYEKSETHRRVRVRKDA